MGSAGELPPITHFALSYLTVRTDSAGLLGIASGRASHWPVAGPVAGSALPLRESVHPLAPGGPGPALNAGALAPRGHPWAQWQRDATLAFSKGKAALSFAAG